MGPPSLWRKPLPEPGTLWSPLGTTWPAVWDLSGSEPAISSALACAQTVKFVLLPSGTDHSFIHSLEKSFRNTNEVLMVRGVREQQGFTKYLQ